MQNVTLCEIVELNNGVKREANELPPLIMWISSFLGTLC